MKKIISLFLTLALLGGFAVFAVDESTLENGEAQLNEIENEYGFTLDSVLEMGIADYFTLFIDSVADQMAEPLRLMLIILLVLLASCVARGISQNDEGVPKTVDTVLTVVFFVVLLSPIFSIQSELIEAIIDCGHFMNSFTMVFATLLLTSGQVGTASVATVFFGSVLMFISEVLINVVLPLAGVYLALRSTALCVSTLECRSIAELLRKAIRWVLLGLATLFTAIMSMQSIIAGAADNMAIKTGKFIVGSGVPIIGGVVQDAINAVLGGISALKTTAGVTAILAVIVMFAPLFIKCVVYIAVFSISAAAAEITGSDKIMQLMNAAGGAVEIYFSSIVLLFLVITISMITLMLTGGAI